MKKSKALMALVLAVLLMVMSLAAEAAARLVDRDAGRRNQAIIDSGGEGTYCDSCNGTEGGGGEGQENTIIFE